MVGFDIITMIICPSKSHQMKMMLLGLNLTKTCSRKLTALDSVSTIDDQEILINWLGPTIILDFQSSIQVDLAYDKTYFKYVWER